jgi:hypothetical protein
MRTRRLATLLRAHGGGAQRIGAANSQPVHDR